jgi:4-diphosphocytidyl-2-C-methyl-D-erythritol kinase
MEIHRSAADITVLAPAKLNLYFEVLAQRLDGFHEIETLMVPIGLYDLLRFRPDDSGVLRLECRWAEDVVRGDRDVSGPPEATAKFSRGQLPPERDNLAWRALELLRARSGTAAGGQVELVKRIPAAAGLGGGSSDAAAALIAGNLAWQLNWPVARLADLAAELGSDVPFFLQSGAAVCRGRGERIAQVGRLGALHFLVIRPDAGLSTAQVYARCRPGVSQGTEGLIQALRCGDLRTAARHFCNRLEPAAKQLSPWPGRLRAEFARLDCVVAQMSGSGSSYFGLCRHARQTRRLARRLAARRLGRVFALRS